MQISRLFLVLLHFQLQRLWCLHLLFLRFLGLFLLRLVFWYWFLFCCFLLLCIYNSCYLLVLRLVVNGLCKGFGVFGYYFHFFCYCFCCFSAYSGVYFIKYKYWNIINICKDCFYCKHNSWHFASWCDFG